MYWTIAASAFDTVHTLPSLEFREKPTGGDLLLDEVLRQGG